MEYWAQQSEEQDEPRMLSEELFFVDLSPAVDMYDSSRHDHLCQGRAFLGVTKRSPLEGEMSKFRSQSSSGVTTGPASSSSSSDSRSTTPWEPSNEVIREGDTEELDATLFALSVQRDRRLKEVAVATKNDEGVDPCAAVLRGWQRAWCELMGQWTASRNGKVVYTRQNWASNISFKTFRSLKSGVDIVRRLGLVNDNIITCTTSIAMFRVVSTLYGRHAEYEVHVTCGGRRWVSWKRFTNFKSLASICAAADNSCNEAWGHVVMAKPARRCLNRTYLAFKCRLLEVFLRQAMFAMPTPELLIQFVTRNRNP